MITIVRLQQSWFIYNKYQVDNCIYRFAFSNLRACLQFTLNMCSRSGLGRNSVIKDR
uniref:Uncharacterized protein n=1 Tax=Arundo donax TaxID=35708 RepID=A0A0A8ZZL4_ARUDO